MKKRKEERIEQGYGYEIVWPFTQLIYFFNSAKEKTRKPVFSRGRPRDRFSTLVAGLSGCRRPHYATPIQTFVLTGFSGFNPYTWWAQLALSEKQEEVLSRVSRSKFPLPLFFHSPKGGNLKSESGRKFELKTGGKQCPISMSYLGDKNHDWQGQCSQLRCPDKITLLRHNALARLLSLPALVFENYR